MDEFIPKKRQKSSTEEGIPKKKNKKCSMDGRLGAAVTLLPPWQTRPSIYEALTQYPSPYVYNRHASLFSPRSYDIFLCVLDENGEQDADGKERGHSKLYTIKIHAHGPGKVYPNPLIPFWKGKLPARCGLAALGSHIYCFGGVSYTRFGQQEIRDVNKLWITPRVGKEWVPVSPMISGRCFAYASVLGGRIYVRNHEPCNHTDAHWGEVFDPVNGKWEAFPNPPNYPPKYSRNYRECIIISAALKNPDRIIVAYRVPDDRSYAIFYAYNVNHRSWAMLAPAKRKLHRFCDARCRDDVWLEGAVSVNNTLYWINRTNKWIDRTDEILLIAYDLDLDMWLEGRLKGITNLFFQDYELHNGIRIPAFLHLEKQRFCFFKRVVDDYLHCVIVDVSHMPEEKTLGISVVWDQKYAMEPKKCRGLPAVLSVIILGYTA